MPLFEYRGLDSSNKSVRGSLLADSARHARDLLRQRNVVVERVVEQPPSRVGFDRHWWGKRRARQQWGVGAHELAMLLAAGIPLLEALDTLVSQHRGAFRAAILKLRDRVEAGAGLAAALAEQPEIFDAASVRMVEVGENAGTLENVLSELADYKLQLATFKDSVTTALIYPIFLACFGLSAAIFLMTWVMPPLLDSLQETLPQLPWPTRVAKAFSDVLVNYGWWIIAAVIILASVCFLWVRSDRGQRAWHGWILQLPLVGTLLKKQAISRVAMIVASLTRGGVLLTTAVQLAAKSTSNRVIREALHQAEQDMIAGEDLATSLDRSGVFPPLAVRFFSVGQDTGKLDEMLLKLSRDYNTQVATAAARISSLVEPVMILILAVAVGFLLLATILPILEAGNVS